MALKPTMKPPAGTIGLPAGVKEAGKRVDFKPDDFDLLIETKGYRVAWSRACPCPCAPVNDQTEQPDPNCALCGGDGWMYFKPDESVVDEAVVGELTPLHEAVLETNQASIIHAVMSNGAREDMPYNPLLNWAEGEMMATVRADNKLGYYDRLVNLDVEIIYWDTFQTDGSGVLPLRYLAAGVNFVRSVATAYEQGVDYVAYEDGSVTWVSGKEPPTGTWVVAHYLTHPTWLVTRHPHVIRSSPVKFKTKSPKTPRGDPRALPVQAVVRLEFVSNSGS